LTNILLSELSPLLNDEGFSFLAIFTKIGYISPTMVVRMRHTRAHRDNRRSHHALENPSITKDVKSGVSHLRHRMSLQTGEYRGRKVVDVTAKLEKRAKKASARKSEGR
jgi:ribosomal protein L32